MIPDTTINFTLRLPVELHERISELAKREKRSLHSQVIYILEAGLKDDTNEGDNKQQLLNRS